MEYKNNIDDKWVIPMDRFNNPEYIEKRVSLVKKEDQVLLRAVLDYLYNDGGTCSLASNKEHIIKKYLDEAETILANWLKKRTNGTLKDKYGVKSLLSAKKAKYRCILCGFPDVRCLEFDHIERDNPNTDFACLCGNCHNIKSRKMDWVN